MRYSLALLAACGCSSSGDSIVAGRYTVAPASSCFSGVSFELKNEPDGSLSFMWPGVYLGLDAEGDGYHGMQAGCSTMPGSGQVVYYSIYYREVRITRSSSTSVHVELSLLGSSTSKDGCTTTAALALKDSMTPCELEATIEAPAPMISSVTPSRFANSYCPENLTIRGSGFSPDVRVDYFYTSDADYGGLPASEMGEMIISRRSPSSIVANLQVCPYDPYYMPVGNLRLEVVNPDGQTDSMTVRLTNP